MNKQRKNEKGFTMVELIIVVAIMGIIGALLVPAFGTMSTKAKISTDIATVKTLKRTADAYKAEQGTWPAGNFSQVVDSLKASNYLEGNHKLQVSGADLSNDTTSYVFKLNLTSVATNADVNKALSQIDASTQTEWIAK